MLAELAHAALLLHYPDAFEALVSGILSQQSGAVPSYADLPLASRSRLLDRCLRIDPLLGYLCLRALERAVLMGGMTGLGGGGDASPVLALFGEWARAAARCEQTRSTIAEEILYVFCRCFFGVFA
jgi:hypothetical protein